MPGGGIEVATGDAEALRAIRAESSDLQERWPEEKAPREWDGVIEVDDEGRVASLDLRECQQLQELPAEIGQLVALKSLNLERCFELKALPAAIGRLVALESLDLSRCEQLQALPAAIGQLVALESLRLYGCEQLKELPAEIGRLHALTSLELGAFDASQLPSELVELYALGSLKINGLTVGNAKALREIRAASSDLLERWPEEKAPREWRGVEEVDDEGRVVSLSLFRCEQLQELPAAIGQLVALESLELRHWSQLQALPAEIGQLVALKSLDLCECKQLQTLPAAIGQLVALKSLNLYYCQQLQALPPEIGRLVALESLNLYSCKQLQALPAEIGQLVALKSLDLNFCDELQLLDGASATQPAQTNVAVYATALIVTPRPPEHAAAWLAEHPLAVPTFFKHILSNAAHAEWLGAAVAAEPSLADVTFANERAIDEACAACERAMKKALFLLTRFDVDPSPPLHFSATAAVVAATDHANPDAKPLLRALKAMREQSQVIAELKGRRGLDARYVVAVVAVYVDASVGDDAFASVEAAAAGLDGVTVSRAEGLGHRLELELAQRSGGGVTAAAEADDAPTADSDAAAASATPNALCVAEAGAVVDAAQHMRRQRRKSVARASGYTFLLVLELADRSLSTAIIHDHVAGTDFFLIRKIAADLATALDHLHSKGRIHADLKPLNAVRVGSTWQLIDLDVSCAVGEAFGAKVSSSGYCPPEMARVLLDATDTTGKVDTSKLSAYVASVAFDLWSFGVVLFHLVFGRSFWHTDQNDNVSKKDLVKLASMTQQQVADELYVSRKDPEELKVAVDLLGKLLHPNATTREAQFKKGKRRPMEIVLEHPFFQGQSLDAATLQEMHAKIERIEQNTVTLISLGEEHRSELLRTREVLLKAAFEATEVTTPTAFVVLREPLPEPPSAEQAKLLELTLKDDGSGLAAGGELGAQMHAVHERFEEGMAWLTRLQSFGEGVKKGSATEVFGAVKDSFTDLVSAEKMYFYLVDELTGAPVRGDGYPIEITKPSEVVPQLLPVMQVGMRAMSLYNGAAGIARMFGAPVPTVPEAWQSGAQQSVELLKQESSVEAFGAVHDKVADGDEKKETVRGASLRELTAFFEAHDKAKGYAGLRRVGGDNGAAVWTTLPEADMMAALEARALEFKSEERRRDQMVRMAIAANGAGDSSKPVAAHPTAGDDALRKESTGAGAGEAGAESVAKQLQEMKAQNEAQNEAMKALKTQLTAEMTAQNEAMKAQLTAQNEATKAQNEAMKAQMAQILSALDRPGSAPVLNVSAAGPGSSGTPQPSQRKSKALTPRQHGSKAASGAKK